jgi:hypothetical protein
MHNMLLQKPIEPNDVVTIKLITGEELIARMTSNVNGKITITKPMAVSLGQDRAGNIGIQMVPYFVLTGNPDAKLVLDDRNIIVMTLTNEQAKNSYIQSSSGITMTSGISL